MTWQPIETAPKDGTKIILARFGSTQAMPKFNLAATPYQIHWGVVGFWSDKWNNWNDGVEPSGLAKPTHWMPLPEPPKEPL